MSAPFAPEDRLGIEDTLRRYATSIDAFDFAGVGAVFTDDAVVEYGGYPVMSGGGETAAFLQNHTKNTAWHQHMVTVADVQIDGDTARTITYFIAHAVPKADSESVRLSVGEYRDQLQRTADGWRISVRNQHTGWKEVRTRAPM
jgi:ketosteroid isomerase-like protein